MTAPPTLVPYKRTPVFDENTLPAALRREHRTKPGVWGVIRVLDGRLRYEVLNPVSEVILDRDHFGLVLPSRTSLSRSAPCGCRSSSITSCPACSGQSPRVIA